MHRANDAQIIRMLSQFREDLTDLDAALPVLLEREWRSQQVAGFPLGPKIARRHRLPVKLVEHRLWIERIHLRWPAVQEQVDDALRLGRKVRGLNR
jgi:hypothetical protein